MTIVDSTIVNVLNFTDSFVSIPTQIKPDGYLFEPSINDGESFAIPLSFAEIRVVNSNSNIFREGILRFDPELEEQVYERLGIRDWEEILTDSQIREIILKPNKNGLEKIIKITSSSLMERVRGMLIMLENTGFYDISGRVKSVITERSKEIYNNKRISGIIINSTLSDINKDEESASNTISAEDLSSIKEEMMRQIREELEEEYKSKFLSMNQSADNTPSDSTSDKSKIKTNKVKQNKQNRK